MRLSTTQLARRERVTSQTIRRWIEDERYHRYERTIGGHYRVWIDADPETVLYARVSSARQASSLDRQVQILRERYPDARIARDIASGFNFRRRGFLAILERALRGDPVRVVATTSDRITRSGLPLIRHILELSGGGVELLEEQDQADPFDVRELVAFITSFCNSVHGKRAHQRDRKDPRLPKG
ncbi:recombinase family protein [Salipiger mucosus]|uniref:recombinase family protein n=1 Tax=Salipiger mucosus TaxID=263378 RepID=UPI0009FCBDBD